MCTLARGVAFGISRGASYKAFPSGVRARIDPASYTPARGFRATKAVRSTAYSDARRADRRLPGSSSWGRTGTRETVRTREILCAVSRQGPLIWQTPPADLR